MIKIFSKLNCIKKLNLRVSRIDLSPPDKENKRDIKRNDYSEPAEDSE